MTYKDSIESACNTRDPGLIPGLERSTGEGKGYLLQYSGLEKSMDCIVHGVAKSWIRLSNFHFLSLTYKEHEGTSCGDRNVLFYILI